MPTDSSLGPRRTRNLPALMGLDKVTQADTGGEGDNPAEPMAAENSTGKGRGHRGAPYGQGHPVGKDS